MEGGNPPGTQGFPPGSNACFKEQHLHFKSKWHPSVQQLLPAQVWAIIQALGPTKAHLNGALWIWDQLLASPSSLCNALGP